MRSSTNISCRRSRTAVPGAWSGRSHLAFVATLIAACCVAGCDAACVHETAVIPAYDYRIPDRTFFECDVLHFVTFQGNPDPPFQGSSVTSIGIEAFRGSALQSITIPNSVTSIGNYAFAYCVELVSVIIGDSVTSIPNGAFRGCNRLVSVTIPDSVSSIAGSAFAECSRLASVTIPDSVSSLGDYAFAECSSLKSVTIPDSVTSIGTGAFVDCFCDPYIFPNLYVAGANFLDCVTVVPPPTSSTPTASPTPAPTCAAVTPETDAEALICAAAATFPSLSGIIQAMQTKADLLAFLDGPAVTATIAAASQEAIAAADRCYQNPNGHGC